MKNIYLYSRLLKYEIKPFAQDDLSHRLPNNCSTIYKYKSSDCLPETKGDIARLKMPCT